MSKTKRSPYGRQHRDMAHRSTKCMKKHARQKERDEVEEGYNQYLEEESNNYIITFLPLLMDASENDDWRIEGFRNKKETKEYIKRYLRGNEQLKLYNDILNKKAELEKEIKLLKDELKTNNKRNTSEIFWDIDKLKSQLDVINWVLNK